MENRYLGTSEFTPHFEHQQDPAPSHVYGKAGQPEAINTYSAPTVAE